jgi:LPS export ABC transporter permease LptG/LPS export ABC transporter permease LptF
VLPYVFLSLLLLTSVLFAQQASRLAEAIIYTDLPFSLLAGIGATLLPGVLTFTIPLATLAGIAIGFSRMGTDSEIVAMRAAGVGSWTLIWPALLVGLFLSGASVYIQLFEAPRAARELEKVALEGALAKLDSPVEPRTFTTLPKNVIYVRDGDKARGTWGRVFISTQQDDGSTRLFTARSGRIDSSGDQSELVLGDVLATKFPGDESKDRKSYVVERFDQLRLAINTGRADIVQRLNQRDSNADSLDWSELRERSASGTRSQRRDARRILNRRAALGTAPLVFGFLAVCLGLRIRRGGRSTGILISLVVAIVYYLLSLLGESLSRAGSVTPQMGAWFPTAFLIGMSLFFLWVKRIPFLSSISLKGRAKVQSPTEGQTVRTHGTTSWRLPNLMDASLFRSLTVTFCLGFLALVAIFNIFTLFELWRFIAVRHSSAALVARYLLFLLPLVSVELFPATMLIAVLVTYALLAKRHEAIAWWASGQSVYRLMFPGLFFAVGIALCSWLIQEHLMPNANLKQDALRARIKGDDPRVITGTGRQWLASIDTHRLYSYEFDEKGNLREPTIYELDSEAVHLSKVVSADVGTWVDPSHLKLLNSETLSLKGMEVEKTIEPETTLDSVESPQIFKPSIDKPSQMSAVGLNTYLKAAKRRGSDVSALSVALQRKYAAPFSVLIMAFIGMPLAVSFGRRGTIIALCSAVVVGIAYWAVGGGFQQLGNLGLLRPSVAGWAPLLIFTAAGTYFLSRVRT